MLFRSQGSAPSPGSPQKFVADHLETATRVKQKYGVPISVCLAQSALETGWGHHVVGNAYFGIKSQSKSDQTVTAPTYEYQNGCYVVVSGRFSAFADFDAAADYYGKFLSTQPRYQDAFKYRDDPEQFAMAVAKAKYATAPNYGQMLMRVMRSEGLEALDEAQA